MWRCLDQLKTHSNDQFYTYIYSQPFKQGIQPRKCHFSLGYNFIGTELNDVDQSNIEHKTRNHDMKP